MPRANTLDAWAAWAGRIGLFAFALFYQLNATVAYVGLALTGLAFLRQAGQWMPRLKRDPVVWAYLGLVLYLAGYALWAAQAFPETAVAQSTAFGCWMHWLAFIPAGWAFFMERQRLGLLLLLLAAGVLARILIHMPWGDLAHIAQWPRIGFGLVETVFAPLAGVTALGVLMLGPRLAAQASPWRRGVFAGLGLAALALLLEALVLTQTRGVWLAAAAVFPPALAFRYRDWLRGHALKSRRGLAVLGLALVLGGVFVQQNAGFFIKRFESERLEAHPSTHKEWVAGGKQVVMTTSIGYRLILWRVGAEKWLQRPWLGWGPGSSEWLLRQTDNPLLNQDVKLPDGTEFSLHLPHLHSLYLEALVRFGVLGALLFFALPLLLLRGVWKACAEGRIPWDYACFLLAGWGFTAVAAAFDFQIFKFAWRNYCVIWAALSYAAYLEPMAPAPAEGETNP
jgi:O-antigen ligase